MDVNQYKQEREIEWNESLLHVSKANRCEQI